MLSKCANPACSAQFRYLRQGRIFNLEIKTLSSDGSGEAHCKVEHYWLCDRCAKIMEVVWQNGALSIRLLPLALLSAKMDRDQKLRRRAARAAGADS